MLRRGLTHEFRDAPAEIRALIVASIVNGQSPRGHAVPVWVTHRQIGGHVAAILNDPQSFRDPILRIARRDARKPQSSLATAGRGCKDYGEAAAER